MSNPKVSIIIPTYGRSEYLKDLIESIRKTTPQGNYEIIVVSSDLPESEKVKWLSQEKDVKIVLAGTRKAWQVRKNSLAHYMNQGVKNSNYEWIFVVNDDMFFAPDWYQELVNFLADPDNSNVGMIVVSTHIGHVSYGLRIPVIGKTKKGDGNWKDLYLSDFAIVKKSVLEEIGLWDEKINWAGYSTDASMAIEFLTNKEIIASEKIKLDHFIVREERNAETINEFEDFNYVKRKWDKLCQEHNCQYVCDFGGVKPYTFKNRLVNYLRKKRQIIFRYKKYLIKYLTQVVKKWRT
ncbi:MAG: hypothetical protein US72_C0002G0022 [Microgenomates group bacterium GW2011_GWC1_38_12]|uniref:Glycosyltransferase 2-like domain-containing protein n=1 Tax=Candidatus Vogelbacteria bacterium RIFOXYB1_FULL_42_16 TaxID=1802436 RepID=A0A1G2QEW7_9BACT|nr:MAG: hypothetical protein US72_C0002G0022 [Microgenomates group bacterium GW2011_GWC1_38_12]KKS78128.1 MAG: hypothetical protein UV50_C0001G0038 [Parcubacteria group bacterium GW2011_GWB1_42_9]OHA59145.1 MAG: hypothetical protein A2370_03090 [Candidatus Vogelbacteria bacterium RIFOXYB1_FULL_42_16]